jgi:hypothetical protein
VAAVGGGGGGGGGGGSAESVGDGAPGTQAAGEVFPLVARGLLRNIALCSSGFASSFASAETPRNACTFLSEKSPLGFRGAFFYRLSREEFSAARSESIVFLSGACGPSGAEGRTCEA